jgi:chromosome segregation ATPase
MLGVDASTINVVLNAVAVLFGGGILGVILAHKRGMIGLSNADKADIRDHYDKELTRLAEALAASEIRHISAEGHLAARLADAESRQRACEEREQELRKRVADLEDEVTGLKRQVARYSAEQVVLLEKDEHPSEDVLSAAERVIRHTEEKKT